MLQFTYPGIYTQEQPSGVRAVSGAPTSVALFVGPTRSGIDGRPTRIRNFGDYERSFGGLTQTSSLSYSVLHFFANGGGEAFVIRVPTEEAKKAKASLKKDNGGNDGKSISIEALSSGAAGNDLFIEIDQLDIGENAAKKLFNLSIFDRIGGRSERFGNLSMAATSSRFADKVINAAGTGSKLIKLTVEEVDKEAPRTTGSLYEIATKPVPTDGKAADDVKMTVSIAVLGTDGKVVKAENFKDVAVTVIEKGQARPASVLELSRRLTQVIGAAIRDSVGPVGSDDLRKYLRVEVIPVDGGKALRVQAVLPRDPAVSSRLADATVTLKAADPANLYGLKAISENASRYALGSKYSPGQVVDPESGDDGKPAGQPKTQDFKNAVEALGQTEPFFNILCLPDLVRPSEGDPNELFHGTAAMSIYSAAALVCERKHAFLLMDPPPAVSDVGAAENYKLADFTFQSSHSAAYFPNIQVDDPLEPGSIRSHPPSGAIAGVFARTDGEYGVWQAPAGTESALFGVYGPSVALSDEDQGVLNPLGLNCIRQFPVYGTVSFGSRTVDGANVLGSEWKYIPVRRTASYILRSLSEALRWAVHKPNGEPLWSELRLNTTAFMHGLFRQGAFKGVSSREAYFVHCDASTTTPEEIDNGVVNVVIGFAPLKPAEFVVISLRQIAQSSI